MELKSLSEKRLIIEGKVNDKVVNFLVDTGASIGLISEDKRKEFNLAKGKKYRGILIGGSGNEIDTSYICDTPIQFGNVLVPQFIFADISDIRKSIKKETGVQILGIIGLPQMKIAHMSIDIDDGVITFDND